MDEIRFSTAAGRHGVSKSSVLDVMGTSEPEEHRTKSGSTGYLYRGRDAGGRELEVIVIDVTKGGNSAWLVIHAMPTSLNKGKTRKKDSDARSAMRREEAAVKAKHRPPVVTSDTQVGPDVDLDKEDVRLRDGTRLTSDLVEAITEDVRRAAGRPSLSGGRMHSPQVSARITPELQEEIRKYSERSGLTHSQVVRRALEQFVEGHPAAATTRKQSVPAKPERQGQRKDPAGHP